MTFLSVLNEYGGRVGAEAVQPPLYEAGHSCVACGGRRWVFARAGVDLYRPSAGTFKLERCIACGHVMQVPAPTADELSKAYAIEYVDYRPAWKQAGWPIWKILRAITTWRRVRRLERYCTGKKLLEVGTGAGDFIRAAYRHCWEVCGVEYNRECAQKLKAETGIDVRPGELLPGIWQTENFDVVAIWNVLEHLPDPVESLRIAGSYLRRGGNVLIHVPTSYSVEMGRRFGPYWRMSDLPRHLNFFNRESLRAACGKAGLELTTFRTSAIDVAWCYLDSVRLRAQNAHGQMRMITGVLSGVISVIGLLPWMAIRAWSGRGTEAFVIAVKR